MVLSALKVSQLSSKRRASQRLDLELLETRCLLSSTYGQLPLAFEPNVGQTSAGIDFIARGSGYGIALTSAGATLDLKNLASGGSSTTAALSVRLVGGNPASTPRALQPLAGVSNYLIGNDPSKWHTNVPTFGQVEYQQVYPGVDLSYYGNERQLEYDLTIHPGASPGGVRLAFDGAQSMSLNANGDLVLHVTGGDVIEKAPTLYQTINGVGHAVAGRYILQNDHSVGFAVGAYDATQPLVIDPYLSYSSYLGGTGDDRARAIAVDASGSAYVAGFTASTNFPTASPRQSSLAGSSNAFVSKLNPAGTGLIYSTYLGGSNQDFGEAIRVDAAGNAYVAGSTLSSDFPTTAGAFQTQLGGGLDAFVTKLSADGHTLVYSTYLGGASDDQAFAIAIDGSGAAYVTGQTLSSNFPTTAGPFSPAVSVAVQTSYVTKLSADGSTTVYSRLLGGSGSTLGDGIAVSAAGNAYVTGLTMASNFPTTAGAFQTSFQGTQDAFVTQVAANGGSLVYSTYLSGGNDFGDAIALDAAGNAYVTGGTISSTFPTTQGAFQTTSGGGQDAFVSKLNAAGSSLVYSTYLGGNGADEGNGIAVDATGAAYVTGDTASRDFPTTVNAFQLVRTSATASNAFVTKLDGNGAKALYSSYLGGIVSDAGAGIAVDALGNAYVAGTTASADFPVTIGAFQRTYGGGANDAFVTKVVTWNASDIAVNNTGATTQLLLGTGDGSAVDWTVPPANLSMAVSGPVLGPNIGWIPRADAVGTDGFTRILWDNVNGQTAVFTLSAAGSVTSAGVFGAISGWTAEDITVGADGFVRVLLSSTSNLAALWTLDGSYHITAFSLYNQPQGFTASSIATAPDGSFYLLLTNLAGMAQLYHVAATGTLISNASYGPVAGWVATDVAVGSDSQARILWDNLALGGAAVWTVSNSSSLAFVAAAVYGPQAGWTAVRLAAGTDNTLRLLWEQPNESASIWTLDLNGAFTGANTFQVVLG